MRKKYKEYEIYIKLLYKGLALNSYRPKFYSKLNRGTKLEISEIDYLKSIAGTNQIIYNRSFLSFSLNKEKSIQFESNCTRTESSGKGGSSCIIANPPKKGETKSLSVLIELSNINESERDKYMISNALLYDISYFTKEEEVLIFPFTGFEVTDWETTTFEYTEGTCFYFKFSQSYYDKIKKKYGEE